LFQFVQLLATGQPEFVDQDFAEPQVERQIQRWQAGAGGFRVRSGGRGVQLNIELPHRQGGYVDLR
jgi:hypothetical protein